MAAGKGVTGEVLVLVLKVSSELGSARMLRLSGEESTT
jgi:hypothetical protein